MVSLRLPTILHVSASQSNWESKATSLPRRAVSHERFVKALTIRVPCRQIRAPREQRRPRGAGSRRSTARASLSPETRARSSASSASASRAESGRAAWSSARPSMTMSGAARSRPKMSAPFRGASLVGHDRQASSRRDRTHRMLRREQPVDSEDDVGMRRARGCARTHDSTASAATRKSRSIARPSRCTARVGALGEPRDRGDHPVAPRGRATPTAPRGVCADEPHGNSSARLT